MAARQLRIALAIELVVYGLLAYWLTGRGWSGTASLWLAVGLFLGGRVLVLATGVAFLLADSSPVPPELRIGPLGFLRLVLQEYVGLLLLFVVVMPFERFWLGADRLRPSPQRPPLLLIHGYQCNRGAWFWLRPRLEAAGWVVATHNLEPVLADIDEYAAGIARRIDEVLAATGAKQVILVGHSMGGLASRAYLRRYGIGKVDRLVTLGSPHQGSRLALLAWGPNGYQMRIGSAWLRALEAVELPPGSASIYSMHDNQVMPQRECSELAGARNLPLAGVSHLGMLFSPRVLGALQEQLQVSVRSGSPASSG